MRLLTETEHSLRKRKKKTESRVSLRSLEFNFELNVPTLRHRVMAAAYHLAPSRDGTDALANRRAFASGATFLWSFSTATSRTSSTFSPKGSQSIKHWLSLIGWHYAKHLAEFVRDQIAFRPACVPCVMHGMCPCRCRCHLAGSQPPR
jgi:hypothetical protein